jgi:hypothetical protein
MMLLIWLSLKLWMLRLSHEIALWLELAAKRGSR